MSSSESPDVVVVGDGLIGLCITRALALAGLRVELIASRRAGYASSAAAGLLAPTIDAAAGPALDFAITARDRYPSFVAELEDETGIAIPLQLDGVLRVPFENAEVATLRTDEGVHARWLSADEALELEPHVAAHLGALFHAHDGTVENETLLQALERSLEELGVARRNADVIAVRASASGNRPASRIHLADQTMVSCGAVVLAPGAWISTIQSLPRPIPVTPLRGQMLAIVGTPVRRPVYASDGYLVPRMSRGCTIAGSTSESVGFHAGTTHDARRAFVTTARRLLPNFPIESVRSWSGLRPMTPDALPILGADPDFPTLFYACGHSRNGILMAPHTATAIAALVEHGVTHIDLSPFSILRFGGT